jgi:ATP-binding cassette subfamily B protein/ATP-binding cassette subfamily C protein
MNIHLGEYWHLLNNYLKPQGIRVLLLAILLLITIGLTLLNPQIVRFFIDTVEAGGPLETLLTAALLFIMIAFVNQGLSILTTYISEDIAWTATNALRLDLTKHCLKLDQSFHKSHTSGELLERIDGDVNALSNFFSQFVVHILGSLVLLMGVLVFLFFEDWRAGLGLSIFALIALVTLIQIRTLAIPYWAKIREQSASFFGFLGEVFAGTEDVTANDARPYIMQRFYQLLRSWLPIEIKANVMGDAVYTATTGLFLLGHVIAFALGAYLWQLNAISIGTVYLIFHYTELLRQPIELIRNQIDDLQRAEASIARVRDLLAMRSKLRVGTETSLPSGPLSITFREVSFGYHEDKTVLHEINLNLQPGQVLGLLGRTGSGKTTLAHLALRLYDPDCGEIRLGGIQLPDISPDIFRRHVRMVTQEVQLFQASVRDNLTFFNSNIPDDQLIAILDDLGLGSWHQALPAGLDTELKSGGRNLSAGQAQLLAFARVFLADPSFIILDEPSSRLDPATERLIERAIDRLLANRTCIIIAHRLATVQRADQIMILKDGRIFEYGQRTQLARDPSSYFYKLCQTSLDEVLI